MNCLRISPGTSRKPGAMLRKCAAQAARSIDGGSLYCTIAVIIEWFPFASFGGLRQRGRRLAERGVDRRQRRGDRIGAVRSGPGFMQLAVGLGLGIAAYRDRQ